MDRNKIVRVRTLNAEIQNFIDLYNSTDKKINAGRDGIVYPEDLLAFLIEDPSFQKIADKIKELDR